MKKRAALVAVLVGIVAVALFVFRNPAERADDDAPVAVNTDSGIAEPTPPSASTPEAARTVSTLPSGLAAIVASRPTLAEAMAEALIVLGPSDQNLISAAREAAITCNHLPKVDPGAAQPEGVFASGGDPARTAAIEKLQAWCKDFDATKFLSGLDQSKVENPIDSLIKGGPAAQLESARRVVRTSRDGFALNQAGQVMIEKDEMPLTTIFGGRPTQGKTELIANWTYATSFANCGVQLGCGPSSPSTLRYCAQYGCPQGADYQTALKSTLAPRDYQDVVDFSRWINSR